MGMLINVMCAIDLAVLPEQWAQGLCQMPEKMSAIKAASEALADHHRGDQTINQEDPHERASHRRPFFGPCR